MGKRKTRIEGGIIFQETQHFRVKWVWILMLCIFLFSIGLTFSTLQISKASYGDLLLTISFEVVLELLVVYFFYTAYLETVVAGDGVYYRWRPFFSRYSFIGKDEIAEAKTEKGPRLSYGYHWMPGFGRVNNTGPDMGILFVLKDGRRIFIGTKRLNSFESGVNEIINNCR